jgi:mycothiol synthase
VADVPALLGAAAAADGVRPVSEDTELRLQHGGPAGGRDLTVSHDGVLAGYARYDEGTAELVVSPSYRRRGHGTALLARLEALAGDRLLQVWAHGDLPAAAALARAHGYERARVLLQMRASIDGLDPDPHPALPADVTVRPFRVGADVAAWLRVNARAFSWHPEQGRMTAEDLALREAEPWFDPEGFLMAWRGDTLLGFHWTKVHPAGETADEPVGEIYVLGVDPDAQGMRLGGALTDHGLAHLRRRGLHQVLLYTEESNTTAVRLYEARGFTRYAVDVAWRRP